MRLIIIFFFLVTTSIPAQILPQRERATIIDNILEERFNTLLPKLMDRSGIDMWVIISREYNEDPVLKTMLPSTWLNARRRTILVFFRNKTKNSIEKLAIARYNVGKNITSAWDKEQEPDQWKALMSIISEKDPETIALNYSDDFGIADGLVKTDYELFMKALPEDYKNRVVSAEKLAVSWIETRTETKLQLYRELVEITHDIITEAFSLKVITPGKTTTDDVVWWMRQKVTAMGLQTWFHPTIDIQRAEKKLVSHIEAFSSGYKPEIIQPGDLLHCDFGITYLRLNTDCQQHAYVPKNGETEAPNYLTEALKDGNRVQDIFTSNFKTGNSGNEILLQSLKEGQSEGLQPSIYTHPLGTYGHSAGPTIGMWDSQGGVPGTGDYPLFNSTVYAIELNTTVTISEWDKDIRIMLEEAGLWKDDSFQYVNGRQEKLIMVK